MYVLMCAIACLLLCCLCCSCTYKALRTLPCHFTPPSPLTSPPPAHSFLTRLLLVHGTLCHYRLARLIKYSFYKNIIFAYVLFFFQLFCGFSGQSLIDGIPAAVYNVFFTSLPILLFALLDRPVRDLTTLEQFPQVCGVFWVGVWCVG